MKIVGTLVIDQDRCKGCGLCVVACPSDVIGLSKGVNKNCESFFISLSPYLGEVWANGISIHSCSFGGYLIDKALWRHTFYNFPQEHKASCWIQRGLTIDSLSSLLLLI